MNNEYIKRKCQEKQSTKCKKKNKDLKTEEYKHLLPTPPRPMWVSSISDSYREKPLYLMQLIFLNPNKSELKRKHF